MKVTYFQQVPYRHLPADFEKEYEAAVSTPYGLAAPELVVEAFDDALGEMMFAADAGFDAITLTEHSQSAYDMSPNPDIFAAAIAHASQVAGLPTGIYPLGRSLGKTKEPLRVAEELAMLDVMSHGRLIAGFPIGLAYDANINNGVAPLETRPRYDENLELILRAWSEPDPFPFNGRFSQHESVNLWPRPVQDPHPPLWITGIGNPRTMSFALEREFGFNYFAWFGAKVAGKRIFDRFWELADKVGKPYNPNRVGFMQTIVVADTDAEAERLYANHVEYFFRKSLGSIPMHRLMLPGSIDIRGVEAILKDPGDFGMYAQMQTATYRELVDAGCVIAGSADTVAEQIQAFARDYGIGNLHAALQFGSMPTELARANIANFAEKVLPRLRPIFAEHDHYWWPTTIGGSLNPTKVETKVTVAL